MICPTLVIVINQHAHVRNKLYIVVDNEFREIRQQGRITEPPRPPIITMAEHPLAAPTDDGGAGQDILRATLPLEQPRMTTVGGQ
jgi:hypothetical protein